MKPQVYMFDKPFGLDDELPKGILINPPPEEHTCDWCQKTAELHKVFHYCGQGTVGATWVCKDCIHLVIEDSLLCHQLDEEYEASLDES